MDDFDVSMAAAKAGDEAAFVALFRSVQPTLLRYLTTLGGALAEDAAAETWVSVVKGLPRFSGDEAGWRAWVFTIGHARLRDAQRRSYRDPVPVDMQAELATTPGDEDVVASVDELMTTEAALRLMGRLPRDQAAAVLLRHMAGLDVAAAAEVLGKRPGAVRVATHRGLQRLATLAAAAGVTTSGQGSITEVTW